MNRLIGGPQGNQQWRMRELELELQRKMKTPKRRAEEEYRKYQHGKLGKLSALSRMFRLFTGRNPFSGE